MEVVIQALSQLGDRLETRLDAVDSRLATTQRQVERTADSLATLADSLATMLSRPTAHPHAPAGGEGDTP